MISLLDSKIKFILTRHEQGAAFMADVYGRLTGKVDYSRNQVLLDDSYDVTKTELANRK